MRLISWWRAQARRPLTSVSDQRPALAAVMCWWCTRRWLAGRRIPHPGCGEELSLAFDTHLRRRPL